MGASAPDIITYIGVPLAVLGVLPILWTAIKTLRLAFDLRRILNINLKHCEILQHVRTDTDILSGKIEIRYELTRLYPLSATDVRFSRLRPHNERSHLPGGSWTALYWHIEFLDWFDAAPKTYVVTDTIRIRQPSVLISFAGLLEHLLALGAEPYTPGLDKLSFEEHRATPGTMLLRNCFDEAVLVVSSREADDDSGTPALRFNSHGLDRCTARTRTRELPLLLHPRLILDEKDWDSLREDELDDQSNKSPSKHIEELTKETIDSTRDDMNDIVTLYSNKDGLEKVEVSQATKIKLLDMGPLLQKDKIDMQTWVTSMAKALGAVKHKQSTTHLYPGSIRDDVKEQLQLNSYRVPLWLRNFVLSLYDQKALVPCGALVYENLMPASACESIWKPEDPEELICNYESKRFHERLNNPSPDHHKDWVTEIHEKQAIVREVAEREADHAFKAPRWGTARVGAAVLPWLSKSFQLNPAFYEKVSSADHRLNGKLASKSAEKGDDMPDHADKILSTTSDGASETHPIFADQESFSLVLVEWFLKELILHPAESAGIVEGLAQWQTWSEDNSVGSHGQAWIHDNPFHFALTAVILGFLGKYLTSVSAEMEDDEAKDARGLRLVEELGNRWKDVFLN